MAGRVQHIEDFLWQEHFVYDMYHAVAGFVVRPCYIGIHIRFIPDGHPVGEDGEQAFALRRVQFLMVFQVRGKDGCPHHYVVGKYLGEQFLFFRGVLATQNGIAVGKAAEAAHDVPVVSGPLQIGVETGSGTDPARRCHGSSTGLSRPQPTLRYRRAPFRPRSNTLPPPR